MHDTLLPNQPVNDATRLLQAGRESLTDAMVERLSVASANALELVDRLNDERTREAIHSAIDRLTELHKVGALDTLCNLVMVLHAARDAWTDTIIERLFTFFEQMINTVGNEAMGTLADNVCQALDESAFEASQSTPRGGLFGTLAQLAKPETQRTLLFLLNFGEKLQQRTVG